MEQLDGCALYVRAISYQIVPLSIGDISAMSEFNPDLSASNFVIPYTSYGFLGDLYSS